MKYKVQFGHSWQGQWEFEANYDLRAWDIARKYISDHTQVVYVSIETIWEIDENKKIIRELPPYEQCMKPKKAKSEKQPKKEKPVMFRAHFSDGQCSGPYIAKSDEEALEIAKSRAKSHADYIKMPTDEIKITAIDEIEMFKAENNNNWYIKTPLTTIRAVDL